MPFNGSIAIIGSLGQLGSDLVQICQIENIAFNACDLPEIDITSIGSISAALNKNKPAVIVNCAAYTAVDKAEEEKDMAYLINGQGAGNLAIYAKEIDIPLIQISTDYVFSGEANKPYKEDDAVDPQGVYGLSKLEGEKIVLNNWGKSIIIRTSWLYGINGHNFVKTMYKLMKEKEKIRVVSDQFGSPTWSFDLARAIIDIIINKKIENACGNIFHYCNSGFTSWHGFAQEIFNLLMEKGIKLDCQRVRAIPTSGYPTPAKRPAHSVLNTDKIGKLLGYALPGWKDSLRKYIELLIRE